MNLFSFEKELVMNKLKEDKRISGRKFDEYRDVKIELGKIVNAAGSAIVTLGKTKVIVGIKPIVMTPFPDNPDEGSIGVNVEMSPMADPNFESGPPSIDSVELSRVVDRGIREGGTLDFKKLVIVSGEKTWMIFIDICVVNNDGNLFDAGNIGTLAALRSTKLPELDENNVIIKYTQKEDLKIEKNPLLFTFVKIGDKILVDPDLNEVHAADARFSLAIDDNGNINAIQKGLNGTFNAEELKYIVKTAKKLYAKRMKDIKK
jgi:exosome complex component RRP42